MKKYSLNMGQNTVMNFYVTTEEPVNPTAENYRFDIKYNETLRDPEFCAVDFYDVDRKDWSALSGSPMDIYLYNVICNDVEFSGVDYIYYTLVAENEPEENYETSIIDVTPPKGD